MKAVVAAFNQEKALVGALSVITNLRMERFEALIFTLCVVEVTTSAWSKGEGMTSAATRPEMCAMSASSTGNRQYSTVQMCAMSASSTWNRQRSGLYLLWVTMSHSGVQIQEEIGQNWF